MLAKFNSQISQGKFFSKEYVFSTVLSLEIAFLIFRCIRPVGGLDAFRQAQTVWPVKVWNKDGFSPFQPSVPIKGVMHESWLLEVPIYQWIVYIVNLIFRVDPVYISRLISLACALYCVHFLATRISRKLNVNFSLVVVLMISNPYMFYWMSTGLVDWLALAFGVIAGQLAISNKGKEWLSLGVCFAILGSGVKPSHSLFGFLLVACFRHAEIKRSQLLMRAGAIAGLMFLTSSLWQKWVSELYPLGDPRSIWSLNSSTYSWYFGSLDQYVHFAKNYVFVMERLIPSFGGAILVAACLFGFLATDFNWKTKLSLIVLPSAYIIGLINLNVSHYYYQIPMALVLSTIMCTGFIYWSRQELIWKFRREFLFVTAAALLISFTITGANMSYIKSVLVDEPARTECLEKAETEKSSVLLVNLENPAFFYECNLKSFQVNLIKGTDAKAFEAEKNMYKFVYVEDNFTEVSDYISSLNGSVEKVNGKQHWYKIIWD